MLRFKYTVTLSEHLPFDGDKKPIETHTGIVEAPDYLSAKEKAWAPIRNRTKEIEQVQGIIVAVGNVQIDRTNEPETITLPELVKRQKAGKTVSADTKIDCTVADINDYTVTLINEMHTDLVAGLNQIWRNSPISKWSVERSAKP